MTDDTAETTTEMAQPIIIDLGKQKSKKVKALKKGEGELWDDVMDVVEEAKKMLGDDADGKVLIPVIILYEKKPKRTRLEKIMFPLVK
jgi:uncharacterized protein (UPF0335 family)